MEHSLSIATGLCITNLGQNGQNYLGLFEQSQVFLPLVPIAVFEARYLGMLGLADCGHVVATTLPTTTVL